MITLPQLRTICPNAPKNVDVFIPYLNQVMDKYSINTKRRKAAFIAQIAHESGEFKYVREIASGKAYEGRKDLGNVIQGDGVRFKGRGLIQLTGRANYKAISKDLGIDFEANPELLETPQYAVLSAGWYWNKRNLNAKADTIGIEDETRAINGGLNGLSDRQKYFDRAMKVI